MAIPHHVAQPKVSDLHRHVAIQQQVLHKKQCFTASASQLVSQLLGH